jgi:hypothetical protein
MNVERTLCGLSGCLPLAWFAFLIYSQESHNITLHSERGTCLTGLDSVNIQLFIAAPMGSTSSLLKIDACGSLHLLLGSRQIIDRGRVGAGDRSVCLCFVQRNYHLTETALRGILLIIVKPAMIIFLNGLVQTHLLREYDGKRDGIHYESSFDSRGGSYEQAR